MAHVSSFIVLAALMLGTMCQAEEKKEKSYDLRLTETTLTCDKAYYKKCKVRLVEGNGEDAMSGNIIIEKELPEGATIEMVIEDFQQNTWQTKIHENPSPVQKMKQDKANIFKQLQDKCTGMTENFPLDPQNVTINGFVPIEEPFPDDIAEGKWRVILTMKGPGSSDELFKWNIGVRAVLK